VKIRKFVLAGAAVIALLPSAAAMASTTPSPMSTFKLPNGVTFNPKTAKCETVRTAAGPSTRCTQVTRLPLKDLTAAQRAERRRMMTGLGKRQRQRSSAAASAAVIPAPPADCDFSGIEFDLTATLHPNRFLSCADSVLTLFDIQTAPTFELLGVFSWEDQQWATLSPRSLTWTHGLQVLGYSDAFGDLADGISGALFSNCLPVTSNCTETSLGLPDPQSVTVAPGGTYNFGWDETDTGAASTGAGQEDILNAVLGVVWLTTGGDQSEFDDTGTLAVRCDSIVRAAAAGCVDQAFTPTLTYNSVTKPRVGPVAQHIYDAQNGGLVTAWGVPSSVRSNGAVLTRDMNPADIKANRAAACGGVRAPRGDSCDEYPLATTHQGAAFNSDYSTAIVPVSANRSQGGLTRAFYRSNRVLDPDPFYVLAILRNGTPSW
jgi:hypothetical protein